MSNPLKFQQPRNSVKELYGILDDSQHHPGDLARRKANEEKDHQITQHSTNESFFKDCSLTQQSLDSSRDHSNRISYSKAFFRKQVSAKLSPKSVILHFQLDKLLAISKYKLKFKAFQEMRQLQARTDSALQTLVMRIKQNERSHKLNAHPNSEFFYLKARYCCYLVCSRLEDKVHARLRPFFLILRERALDNLRTQEMAQCQNQSTYYQQSPSILEIQEYQPSEQFFLYDSSKNIYRTPQTKPPLSRLQQITSSINQDRKQQDAPENKAFIKLDFSNTDCTCNQGEATKKQKNANKQILAISSDSSTPQRTQRFRNSIPTVKNEENKVSETQLTSPVYTQKQRKLLKAREIKRSFLNQAQRNFFSRSKACTTRSNSGGRSCKQFSPQRNNVMRWRSSYVLEAVFINLNYSVENSISKNSLMHEIDEIDITSNDYHYRQRAHEHKEIQLLRSSSIRFSSRNPSNFEESLREYHESSEGIERESVYALVVGYGSGVCLSILVVCYLFEFMIRN